MVKVLIVDDEPEIREGIAGSMAWEELGVTHVFMADNVESALHIYRSEFPDLIITDIRMPGASGFDLIEAVYSQESAAKVLLISGYNDFQYARRALHLNVADYLLKPLQTEEMKAAIQRTISALKAERGLSKENWKQSLPLLQRDFLQSLITDNLFKDEPALLGRLESLELGWIAEMTLLVCAVELDNYRHIMQGQPNKAGELAMFTVSNVLEETVSAYGNSIVLNNNRSGWYVVTGIHEIGHDDDAIRHYLNEMAEQILRNVRSYTKFSVSVGISSVSTSWLSLPELYDQAIYALNHKKLLGGNMVYCFDMLHEEKHNDCLSDYSELQFLHQLRTANEQGVRAAIAIISAADIAFDGSIPIQRHFLNWVLQVQRILEQSGHIEISVEDSFNLWEKLEICETMDTIRDSLAEHFSKLCRRIKPSYSQIVQQATEFIKGNVRNKITIAQVARHVHVTSGWLSQLFRQELGTTFLDYVTKLKMDEARVLLSRNMLVIETAAELGYQDSEYFAKVFKKHWGSSPAEFKKWKTGLSRR